MTKLVTVFSIHLLPITTQLLAFYALVLESSSQLLEIVVAFSFWQFLLTQLLAIFVVTT